PAAARASRILSMQCYDGVREARAAAGQVRKLREQIRGGKEKASDGPVATALDELDRKAAALEGERMGGRGRARRAGAARGGGGPACRRCGATDRCQSS